jgi:hypothetical protein
MNNFKTDSDLEANLCTMSVNLEPILANNVQVVPTNNDNDIDKCYKFIKILCVLVTGSAIIAIIGTLVIWYASSL